jgi:hypothetical protein
MTKSIMNSVELYINKSLDTYDPRIDKKTISEYIHHKVDFFKHNLLEDNSSHHTKTFNEGTGHQIDITVKSINIIFQLTNKNSNVHQTVFDFFLPFELLPLYYSLNFITFHKFIAFYIKLKFEGPFKEVIFNDKNFKYMMSYFSELKFEKDTFLSPASHRKVYKFPWIIESIVYDVIIKYISIFSQSTNCRGHTEKTSRFNLEIS